MIQVMINLAFWQLLVIALVLGISSGFADALFDWLFAKLRR